ncbi:MAG: hypothetical protein ACE5NN_06440 [Candidatus Bathyarchaeia archaeon]
MQSLHTPTLILPQPCISSMETLTFGIEELDRLFGGLKLGQLVAFHGSWTSHILSELLCVRSQLPKNEGGLESSVVFVDGGNIFNPYLISENARLLGLAPEETLQNIWISRAFTCYQLTALITEELPKILDREGPRLVVISDIAHLYCDSDIGLWEAKRTFNRITLFLWNLVREKDIILLATSLSTRHRRKWCLEQYLLGRADVAAEVEDGNPHVKISLEKHPSKPSASVELFLGEFTAQSLLEDFMEV